MAPAPSRIFNSEEYVATLNPLPQFGGATNFIAAVEWRQLGFGNTLCFRRPPNEPIEIAKCILVGRVSYDKAYLESHGNFSTTYKDLDKSTINAKLQFTLERSTNDEVLGGAFDRCYENAEVMEGLVAGTLIKNHFLSHDNKRRTMRLNIPLWEKKNAENNTPDRNAITSNYTVNAEATPFFDKLKSAATHQICLPAVYDVDENIITSLENLPRRLCGADVELLCTFKHYPIPGNPDKNIAPSDTFAVNVETITILRNPPLILRSPVQFTPRKPKHVALTGIPTSSITQPNFGSPGSPSSTSKKRKATTTVTPAAGTGTSAGSSSSVSKDGDKKMDKGESSNTQNDVVGGGQAGGANSATKKDDEVEGQSSGNNVEGNTTAPNDEEASKVTDKGKQKEVVAEEDENDTDDNEQGSDEDDEVDDDGPANKKAKLV